MRCSGCGKDVPFTGKVCPYCQRDKSRDQTYTMLAMVFGIGAGWLGAVLFGVWGAIGGFVLGCVIALVISGAGKSAPPKVQIAASDKGGRLRELKALLDEGLIEQAEYEEKKREILKAL